MATNSARSPGSAKFSASSIDNPDERILQTARDWLFAVSDRVRCDAKLLGDVLGAKKRTHAEKAYENSLAARIPG